MNDAASLACGLKAGDRRCLARAITLLESRLEADQAPARELRRTLDAMAAPRALRVGISGLPGAGKSTLLDALGARLLERGERVAVLAIDPSSDAHGGSILGDKTRMARLASRPDAFVRPSPSAGALGGVTFGTDDAIVACEAAGYSVVFVETVGVGQSEHAVADLVDVFVVVLVAGMGDGLQWMKCGILELVDIVAVNKADGVATALAEDTAREMALALTALRPGHADGRVEGVAVSAREGKGLDALWTTIVEQRSWLESSGLLGLRRRAGRRAVLESILARELRSRFAAACATHLEAPVVLRAVDDGAISPREGAARLLTLLR